MSRRTSEASKAIRKAWEKEQRLVAEGKGTRDWTVEQQNEILKCGKAYHHNDDPNDKHDGGAFIGHHMKSAEAYPEYQCDADNIQFLSYPEHQEAHKGNWKIPSNWYYNPQTKEYVDFGENKYDPCEVISLSEPVRIPVVESKESDDTLKNSADSAKEKAAEESQPSPQKKESAHSEKAPHRQVPTTPPPEVHESFGDKVMHAVKAVKEFDEKHPVIAGIVKWGGAAALAAVLAYVASKSSGSGGGRASGNDDDGYFSPSDSSDDYSGNSTDTDYDDLSVSRDYPDERSSPREHDVSGYDRQQNGRTVHVNPYKRGGKHDDDN